MTQLSLAKAARCSHHRAAFLIPAIAARARPASRRWRRCRQIQSGCGYRARGAADQRRSGYGEAWAAPACKQPRTL